MKERPAEFTGRVHIVANEREATEVMVADVARVAYVTQTTLCDNDVVGIMAILSRRFPEIKGPKSNICFGNAESSECGEETG